MSSIIKFPGFLVMVVVTPHPFVTVLAMFRYHTYVNFIDRPTCIWLLYFAWLRPKAVPDSEGLNANHSYIQKLKLADIDIMMICMTLPLLWQLWPESIHLTPMQILALTAWHFLLHSSLTIICVPRSYMVTQICQAGPQDQILLHYNYSISPLDHNYDRLLNLSTCLLLDRMLTRVTAVDTASMRAR